MLSLRLLQIKLMIECFTLVVDLISDSPFSTFGGHSTGILKKQVFIFYYYIFPICLSKIPKAYVWWFPSHVTEY
jgi:hypothetical protein